MIRTVGRLGAAAWCLVLARTGRTWSHAGGEKSSSHRCRAQPVFSALRNTAFVVDGLVEECDDLAVPHGMPFSLRLVSPGRDDYLFSRLRALLEDGHPFWVGLEETCTGRKARLSANGWTWILEVGHTSGWPPILRRRDRG